MLDKKISLVEEKITSRDLTQDLSGNKTSSTDNLLQI